MSTNEYSTTIEHIRQDERNDVFKATYQGMEAFYTFPRSMEMKAEDVHDYVNPEDFQMLNYAYVKGVGHYKDCPVCIGECICG